MTAAHCEFGPLTLRDVEFSTGRGAATLTLGADAVRAIVHALSPHIAPPAASSPYMTVPEVAEYLRAPRHRVYGLLSERKLPRHKEGRRTLIRRADVDAYLASMDATGPGA